MINYEVTSYTWGSHQVTSLSCSLTNLAKDWLYYIPPDSATRWTNIIMLFPKKFFLATRVISIKKRYILHQANAERDYNCFLTSKLI